MSIDTLTGDEFARLDATDHEVALALYDGAISYSIEKASQPNKESEREMHLDQLTSLLTLRKLHKVRLAEMQEETEPQTAQS